MKSDSTTLMCPIVSKKERARQNRLRFVQWIVSGMLFNFCGLYKIRNAVYRHCFCIGRNPIVLDHVSIQQLHYLGGTIKIGDNVVLQKDVVLDYSGGLEIGSGVVISQGSYVLSHMHDIGGPSRRSGSAKATRTFIGEGVWVGAKCIVLGGVKVGKGSVVGAGSLVTKDVPENVVVGGVPARILKQL